MAAGLGDVAAAHRDPAVVVVHEDGVAADLVDETILQRTIFRAGVEDRAAAVRGPVAAHQRFLVLHEGPRGVAEGQALEADEPHRRLLRAAELDQMPQADGFDRRLGQINARGRIEVQGAGLAVEEPLARRIQFLEDVLHETDVVHAHRAVVLPAAFVGDLVVRALAGDDIVHAAPLGGMQGMDEPAGRVFPSRRPLRAEGILRPAVEVVLLGVEVRIPRHGLARAIDEKLVRGKARGHLGLHDAVLVRFPLEVLQPDAAADHRLLLRIRLIHDRSGLRAGILGGEDQGLGQIVRSLPDEDRHGFAPAPPSARPAAPAASVANGFSSVPGFASFPPAARIVAPGPRRRTKGQSRQHGQRPQWHHQMPSWFTFLVFSSVYPVAPQTFTIVSCPW